MKNYINNNTGILIRIDDVCENMDWKLMSKLESLFDKYSIKPVLGVIPHNKDDSFFHFQGMIIFGSKFEAGKVKDGK